MLEQFGRTCCYDVTMATSSSHFERSLQRITFFSTTQLDFLFPSYQSYLYSQEGDTNGVNLQLPYQN